MLVLKEITFSLCSCSLDLACFVLDWL
jgi:hypothetical protein